MGRAVDFSAFQIVDDIVYFSLAICNGLYSYNLLTGDLKFITYFEREKLYESELHLDSLLYDGKIYFIPYMGTCISIFDVNTQSMTYVEIGCSSNYTCSFIKGFIHEKKLWLVPQTIVKDPRKRKNICVLDLENLNYEEPEALNNMCRDSFGTVLCYDTCRMEEHLVIPIEGTNRVLIINMNDASFCIKEFREVNTISTIEYIKESFWISECKKNVIKRYSQTLEFIDEFVDENAECVSERAYRSVYKWKERIYIFPNEVTYVSYIENDMKIKEIIKNAKKTYSNRFCKGQLVEYKNSIFIAPAGKSDFIKINSNNECEVYDMQLNYKQFEKIQEIMMIGVPHKVVYEGEYMLKDYIELIKRFS